MEPTTTEDLRESVVIGGGQAGLVTGYHLKQLGVDHVILDENEEVGAAWRNRWDSLHLFTPGRYNDLPGMPYPRPKQRRPGKDEIADYLEAYVDRFQLPLRTGVRVDRVSADRDEYIVETDSERIRTKNVVVATGAFHRPRVPDFAGDLDSHIVQLHSSEYRRPAQVQEGDVLVVGAGSSGAEIALDLAKDHRVWISGRDPGEEPTKPGFVTDRLLPPVIWFLASRVVNVANPIGRKVRDSFLYPPKGIPRGGVSRKTLFSVIEEWVGKTTGVENGLPEVEGGRVMDVANVIWCTGFVTDFGWIDLPVFDDHGYPIHDRGVAESQPGLYFMGLLFQRTLSSALVGGMGRDAGYVARHIKERISRSER